MQSHASRRAEVEKVRELVARLSSLVSLVGPVQTSGELLVVPRGSGASAAETREILLEFSEAFGTAATEARMMAAATDLTVDHDLQFWDALIVTAAPDARCSVLLSEDMHDGLVTRGMTISDPLADQLLPKLATLPAESGNDRRWQKHRSELSKAVLL